MRKSRAFLGILATPFFFPSCQTLASFEGELLLPELYEGSVYFAGSYLNLGKGNSLSFPILSTSALESTSIQSVELSGENVTDLKGNAFSVSLLSSDEGIYRSVLSFNVQATKGSFDTLTITLNGRKAYSFPVDILFSEEEAARERIARFQFEEFASSGKEAETTKEEKSTFSVSLIEENITFLSPITGEKHPFARGNFLIHSGDGKAGNYFPAGTSQTIEINHRLTDLALFWNEDAPFSFEDKNEKEFLLAPSLPSDYLRASALSERLLSYKKN